MVLPEAEILSGLSLYHTFCALMQCIVFAV